MKNKTSKEESEKIMKSVKDILEQNILLTLSTLDKKNNRPCSSTAYYVFDKDLNLYFWSSPKALHSKNIMKNPRVAVNIFNSSQKWGSLLKGLQILGKAREANNKELLVGGTLYLKRFPKVMKFVKKIFDFNSKKLESKMYKIEINKIKAFDEEVFGKEGFREIDLPFL